VEADKRAKAIVTVSSQATVTGTVHILLDGDLCRTVNGSTGRAVVKLPKLRPGGHRLRAMYAGGPVAGSSTSTPVTLDVIRKRP
jgi:hypothetical protein